MKKLIDQIIKLVLEHGIIKTNFRQPITFKSGIRSPIYCNFRETAAYPKLISLIIQAFKEKFFHQQDFDVIMGVYSGAASYAERLAGELNLPSAWVRPGSTVKNYGLGKLIEGADVSGKRVLLIEDLISTGGSIIENAKIIKNAGAAEVICVSIFTYGMQRSIEEFKEADLKYESLLTIHDLLPQLKNTILGKEFEMLESWITDPKKWFDNYKTTFDFGYLTTLRTATLRTNSIVSMGLDVVIEALPQDYASKGIIGFSHFFDDLVSEMKSRNVFPGAFKPNEAFYLKHNQPRKGIYAGNECLNNVFSTSEMLGVPVIFDVKRGDIGNTSKFLADALFNGWDPSAITVHTEMGEDSVLPFAEYCNINNKKGVYGLNLTSNKGSKDFQKRKMEGGKFHYEEVSDKLIEWAKGRPGLGFVAGATNEELELIFKKFAGKDIPGLIPGVGTQGATMANVARAAKNANFELSLLRVNSSSGVTHPWYKKPGDKIPSVNESIEMCINELNLLNEQAATFLV